MSDEELIYLFLVIKNDWAFEILYQKYQPLIINFNKKIFYKFFSIPLELSDLLTLNYFIFYQSIFDFQANKNKSFKNFFFNNLWWGILKYFKKYASKNHQVLNLATSYQENLINNNFDFSRNFFYFDFNKLKLSFCEKNVLKLKYQGFSNQEIMKKLNMTYKQVDNAFQRVIEKLKNKLAI